MRLAIALAVEVLLIAMLAVSLRRRGRFVSRYPEFRRFYDYGLIAFAILTASKALFLLLDLRDYGSLELSPKQSSLLNSVGNSLLLLGLLMILVGWFRLLNVITERYEVVPVVEFEREENGEPLKPGLYLCNLSNCCTVLARLLRGRAGLIVSRNPPDVVRERLGIEKTPILWLTTIEDKNAVSPTRLEFLLQTLVNFMRKTEDPKVIFLDGVEYLMLENGFASVFKFLTTLKDYASLHNTVIVVPLTEEGMDERNLKLLQREFERLKGQA